MKKFLPLFFLGLFFLAPPPLKAGVEPVIQKLKNGLINWTSGFMVVEETVHLPAASRLTANDLSYFKKIAYQNALAGLYEVVKNIYLESELPVKKIILENEGLDSKIKNFIKKQSLMLVDPVSGEDYTLLPENRLKIRLQLFFYGKRGWLGEVLKYTRVETFTQVIREGWNLVCNRPAAECGSGANVPVYIDPVKPISGLIIDARKKNFNFVVAPRLLGEKNEEIYSLARAGYSFASDDGPLVYVKAGYLWQLLSHPRICPNPVVIKVDKVVGAGNSDFVLNSLDLKALMFQMGGSAGTAIFTCCKMVIWVD